MRFVLTSALTWALSATVLTAQRSPDAPANAPAVLRLSPASEPGTPLRIRLAVHDPDDKPVRNASVYAYQTDARGWYTAERADESANPRLYGYLRSGAQGTIDITTIRPASYPNSRVPQHVHFVIRAPGFRERVFEIVFDDDPNMDSRARSMADQPQSVFVICRPQKVSGIDQCTNTVRLVR